MVRPKFQPLKAKRFHGLVSDAQMKGRSSISCCESPKSETDPSVTSYHPHLEGEGSETCGGEDSRRVSGHGQITREAVKLKHDAFKGAFLASASHHFWKEVHFVKRNQLVHTFFRSNCPFSRYSQNNHRTCQIILSPICSP